MRKLRSWSSHGYNNAQRVPGRNSATAKDWTPPTAKCSMTPSLGRYGGREMRSKAFQRFSQRTTDYRADIEYLDLLSVVAKPIPFDSRTIASAFGGDATKYPILGSRENGFGARVYLKKHIKRTLYAAFIKDLYEDFVEYLGTIVAHAALKGVNPDRFVGDVKLDLKATDLLACRDWDGVVTFVSGQVFRKLEDERSTKSLIKKISSRLGLTLNSAKIDAAMVFLDTRHVLVHQDGKPDSDFIQSYPGIKLEGGKIRLDKDFADQALKDVVGLAHHIDVVLIRNDMLLNKHIHPNRRAGSAP